MMKKAAVIDMGTNTFHLLLVSMEDFRYDVLYKEKIPVKIGQGGINKNIIMPDAQKRAFHTLMHFSNLIKGEKIEQIYAFATSAVRNAKNGAEFIEHIQKKIGIRVNVIDGDREADLIYKGIRLSKSLNQDICLMMDIGGGSVEFIIGNEEEAIWKKSFEIGGQRMLDLFHYHDPILPEEIDKLDRYLEEELKPLLEAIHKYRPEQLVGASGTFDTLTDIYLASITQVKSKNIHHHLLPIKDFYAIAERLVNLSKKERLKIPGMIPMRVDMIVVASCLIQFILKHVPTDYLSCSTFSLKEGVLSELMTNEKTKFQVKESTWQYE
ncbi:MAG: exopolyphosphatase [Cyclobacteriaceae bacterium]